MAYYSALCVNLLIKRTTNNEGYSFVGPPGTLYICSSLFTISDSQQKINNKRTNKYIQIKSYRIGLLKTQLNE